MSDERKGLLDDILAPFGKNLVDPSGKVSGMLGSNDEAAAAAAAAALEEEKRRRALAEAAAQRSAMEAAAAQGGGARKLSSWNPFVLLFGQPGESNSTGLLNK